MPEIRCIFLLEDHRKSQKPGSQIMRSEFLSAVDRLCVLQLFSMFASLKTFHHLTAVAKILQECIRIAN